MEAAKTLQERTYRCINPSLLRSPCTRLVETYLHERYPGTKRDSDPYKGHRKVAEFYRYHGKLDPDRAEIGFSEQPARDPKDHGRISVVATLVIMTGMSLTDSTDSMIKDAGFQYRFLHDEPFIMVPEGSDLRRSGTFQRIFQNAYVITESGDTAAVDQIIRTTRALAELQAGLDILIKSEEAGRLDYLTNIALSKYVDWSDPTKINHEVWENKFRQCPHLQLLVSEFERIQFNMSLSNNPTCTSRSS